MKKIILLLLFSVVFLSFFSCKNKKCAAASSSTTTQEYKNDSTGVQVTFYSKGEGIDGKTKAEFENFLKNYPKKIVYTTSSEGREGETDYCLKINELSPKEQIDFMKKAKELLGKSKLVHVNENTTCVHKD